MSVCWGEKIKTQKKSSRQTGQRVHIWPTNRRIILGNTVTSSSLCPDYSMSAGLYWESHQLSRFVPALLNSLTNVAHYSPPSFRPDPTFPNIFPPNFSSAIRRHIKKWLSLSGYRFRFRIRREFPKDRKGKIIFHSRALLWAEDVAETVTNDLCLGRNSSL